MTGQEKGLELAEAAKMAEAVLSHHFGRGPDRMEHQSSGVSNFVFSVRHSEGLFTVRISPDPARIHAFIKEQWAVSKAREAGVPTAEVLEVGCSIVPYPYMVSRTVKGQEATEHPKRQDILEQLGRYGAAINSIATRGFGETFDWSGNQLSLNATWEEFLADELKLDSRLASLEAREMLTPERAKRVRSIISGVPAPVPRLSHGDLRLKNTIVSEDGTIAALIDWEHCVSSVAPAWDLSLALHDLSIDDKNSFLQGYALPLDELEKNAPLIKALNIVHYGPKVEALDTRKDARLLEHYRIRLSGILDLYCI